MLLFTFSRTELDKCCPKPYNERMEVLPPPLIGGRVKCFLFFAPAPRLYRAGRVNPNTLSGFALGSRSRRRRTRHKATEAAPALRYAAIPTRRYTRADAAGRTRGGAFPR